MANEKGTNQNAVTERSHEKVCGIIMPISGDGVYSKEHWQGVKEIIIEVADSAGFKAKLVSIADEVRVIHSTIVTNIYENPIVVCDVSSKNPNVMFELGLRLAFDKPTILIKDEITDYNFDTSPVEHLTYAKSLHYHTINNFKLELKNKITATYSASFKEDYSPFLRQFVSYKKKIEEKEIGGQEYMSKQIELINERVQQISALMQVNSGQKNNSFRRTFNQVQNKLKVFFLEHPEMTNKDEQEKLAAFLRYAQKHENMTLSGQDIETAWKILSHKEELSNIPDPMESLRNLANAFAGNMDLNKEFRLPRTREFFLYHFLFANGAIAK